MHLTRITHFAVSFAILSFGAAVSLAASPNERIVVLISVDGLANFYFDDPKAEMPNIRELAHDGARAQGMRPSTPSVTWPNHTSLVTGVTPARHGVVGNNFFDRSTMKPVALIGDAIYDKAQIVRVPTIYDIAKHAGIETAAIRWPATKNADTIDWTIGDMKIEAIADSATSQLVTEAKSAGIWPAPTVDAAGKPQPIKIDDDVCTNLFLYVMHEKKVRLGLLHIIDVDHDQHEFGPRSAEAYAAVKAADERVGRVWKDLQARHSDRLAIFVVSDHGFSPIEKLVFPNVYLRDAGLLNVKGVRVVGGDVRTVVQGGSVFIYIMDDSKRESIEAKVRETFASVPEVGSVIGRDKFAEYGVADPQVDPHAPDMIVFAKEGYSFGDTAAGTMAFNEKPERKGSHGHDIFIPNLQATFVAWGDGIKAGVDLGAIRNVDVAPTIAKLLALDMPNVDGKVLTDALEPATK